MTGATPPMPPRLLLIDDDDGQLTTLKEAITTRLAGSPATIDIWRPTKDEDFRKMLSERLLPRPTLVVTDHDLTDGGPAGLMGGSVIAWFRAHAVPVGDYSRKLTDELVEPELFDFRFPGDADEAAVEVADLLMGFHDLAAALAGRGPSDNTDSWSATLAKLLDRETAAGSFSLYSVRTGASHAGIIERLKIHCGEDEARRLLATYVLGHLLRNGILKYPGPIMDGLALCSYLAIVDTNIAKASLIFKQACYAGPFGHTGGYFWHEGVDDILLDLAEASGLDGDLNDAGFRRSVMATRLDPGLHACEHCAGDLGGFRCPYIARTVCDRATCSVPTSSWIPQGAYLTRVDRDYFDRWSPLLGL